MHNACTRLDLMGSLKPTFLTQKLCPTDSHSQMKTWFSVTISHLVYEPIVRPNRQPAQNSGYFYGSFSYNVLSFFPYPTVLLLIYYGF